MAKWIDYLRMARDPTKVSHATEAIIRVNVEGIFNGDSRAEKEATNGVHDTLGLASRARSL